VTAVFRGSPGGNTRLPQALALRERDSLLHSPLSFFLREACIGG